MILISDSGSTKTDWVVYDGGEVVCEAHTAGINPVHQSIEDISHTIENELLPSLGERELRSIFFYGAGCAYPEATARVTAALQQFTACDDIEVNSDLLGAARALCLHSEGIACILGTGSNSCLYNGREIIDNISPLGYILGDEGSAAVLGRSLLSDCLKRQLSPAICHKFMQQYGLDTATVLEKVYREPLANRFLGSLAPFLYENRTLPEIHALLMKNFTDFFARNVMSYHHPWLPIHMVGSIAFSFAAELREAADSLGLRMGNIMKSPIEGLIRYHQGK